LAEAWLVDHQEVLVLEDLVAVLVEVTGSELPNPSPFGLQAVQGLLTAPGDGQHLAHVPGHEPRFLRGAADAGGHVEDMTYRWAFICHACYRRLDNGSG